MLEFDGFHAGLCRTLLTQMSEFAAIPLTYLASARWLASRAKPGHLGVHDQANADPYLCPMDRGTVHW